MLYFRNEPAKMRISFNAVETAKEQLGIDLVHEIASIRHTWQWDRKKAMLFITVGLLDTFPDVTLEEVTAEMQCYSTEELSEAVHEMLVKSE